MPLSWIEQISQYLSKLQNSKPDFAVVLVGVGNQLMGDDASGMLVIQKLKASLPVDSHIIAIEGGPVPENSTGEIRKYEPKLVVFIDAGDMGQAAGSIGLFTCDNAEGVSAFGHSLPLSVLGKYLEAELGCQCLLLIIQPERIDFDVPVTAPVRQAIDSIYQTWLELSAAYSLR